MKGFRASAVTTDIYKNATSAGTNSTVSTVACPYHVTLASDIVIHAPGPAPAPSAATAAFAPALLPAIVLAGFCLLSL